MSPRLALAVAVASLLAACEAGSPRAPSQTRYDAWRETRRADVDAYQAFLQARGVAGILPLQELLRSGRRWRHCGASEFAVPPRKAWQAMPATLRLVSTLRAAGVIARPTVASSFRTPGFNRCEGGSAKSRHLANNALDFDLGTAADRRLCAWWRAHGAEHRFGLGFYSPTRIHVDTAGFRTWGLDHTRRTSLCRAIR